MLVRSKRVRVVSRAYLQNAVAFSACQAQRGGQAEEEKELLHGDKVVAVRMNV
jgi:hypothetical protein